MPAERGFALVEMLVAMLLLSLAGLALTRFQTAQLAGTQSAAALAAARIAADNVAVDLMVLPALPAGAISGSTTLLGETVQWTAAPAASPAAAIAPGLVQLEIATRLAPDGAVVARRTLLRPERRQSPQQPLLGPGARR